MMESLDREVIYRYFKGEYSETDASYIRDVFCDENREKELKQFLSQQFDNLSLENDVSQKNLDHILYRIHYDINMKKPEQRAWSFDFIMKWTFRMASLIILPIAILTAIHIFKETRQKKETWVEIKAPAWTRAHFNLPDGTSVWLNSNSAIKYNENFSADRRVILTGEAFFDVHKDKKKPFIVKTNEVTVKVLGTRFNLASYENETNTVVVLEEGKLVFSDREMKMTYTMKPNDLLEYDKSRKAFKTEVVLPQKYSSWTKGKLVFRNDPLDVIARRLERWYNIEVEIDVDYPEDIRWRATFLDENLEEVLNLLKRSLPVDYKIENPDLSPDHTFIKKKVIITQRNHK
jgi:ferric-dicitrate binding protein FerR (iron transport regulator)